MKILFLFFNFITISTYSTTPEESCPCPQEKRPTVVQVNRVFELFKSIGSLASVFVCIVAARYTYTTLVEKFNLPSNPTTRDILHQRFYFCSNVFTIICLADTAYYKWQTFTDSLKKCLDGYEYIPPRSITP